MLAEVRMVNVAPVAGIPIIHELTDGIELEHRDAVRWRGTATISAPVVVRHERGDARPLGMQSTLDVPPWCTFHIDALGEPASLFHGVFGEVDRLLRCEHAGTAYVVRYGAEPKEPVVPLQSELTAFSFALSARGIGLIAHACGFVMPNGRGVLCPGVSGTGKTTLARLLQAYAPDLSLLSDDRTIVTHDDRGVMVWGSPWPGAAQIAGVESAPLDAVVFIRHGTACAARAVSPRDAFRRIVNTLSMPLWEPARCGRALEIVDAIVSSAKLLEVEYPVSEAGVLTVLSAIDRSEPLGSRHAG